MPFGDPIDDVLGSVDGDYWRPNADSSSIRPAETSDRQRIIPISMWVTDPADF